MKTLLSILYLLLLIIFVPFIAIWSLNTLFFSGPLIAYAIKYTFWTWLASDCLAGIVIGTSKS